MDARYTGHYYDLIDKVTKWAKKQPRKGLWERNGRYYLPMSLAFIGVGKTLSRWSGCRLRWEPDQPAVMIALVFRTRTIGLHGAQQDYCLSRISPCALYHRYKAVYAPHPMYLDHDWPTTLVDVTFNGGATISVFSVREHNFKGTTWFFNVAFLGILWRRWLGLRVGDEGGDEFELAQEGRMCLPGVLLHL